MLSCKAGRVPESAPPQAAPAARATHREGATASSSAAALAAWRACRPSVCARPARLPLQPL